MNKYVRFGLPVVAILGTLGWLAANGVKETKTYYKTIAEVGQLGGQALEKRLRVGGDVTDEPVLREGNDVHFTIVQNDNGKMLKLKVVYSGIEPLPDTFKPGAQALADGKLGSDGVFHATKIQAKCASKYEAKPAQLQQPAASRG